MIRRVSMAALFCATAAMPALASAQTNLRALALEGPADATAGTSIPIHFEASALGAAGTFRWTVYATARGAIAGATELQTFGPVALAADETRGIDVQLDLPSNLSGRVVLAASIDALNQVAETNELDNAVAAAGALRIRPQSVDLVAVSASANPSAVRPGEPITIELIVRNDGELAGTADVVALASRVARYAEGRSSPPVLARTDIELGRAQVTVAAGQSTTLQIDGIMPVDAVPGDYDVGALIDPELTLTESIELNNLAITPSTANVFIDSLDFETVDLSRATMFVPFYARLSSYGGDGHHEYRVVRGALPAGLHLVASGDAAGTISGTPLASGSFVATFEVSSNGLVDEAELNLVVVESSLELTIITPELSDGTVSLDYEMQLAAAGGQPGYEWTVVGDLPPGLDITTDGVITGIPLQDGSWIIEVTVRDAEGRTDTRRFILEVEAPNVVILSGQLDEIPLAEMVDVQLEASGGKEPYAWKALSSPPPGLRLTEDGRLTGMATQTGEAVFRVRVTDSSGAESTDTALIHVHVSDPAEFQILTAYLDPGSVRTSYERAIVVEGGVEPLSWRLEPGDQLPSGFELVVEGRRATIVGQSVRPITYGFSVRVTDAAGRRRVSTYVIQIDPFDSDLAGTGGCRCVEKATSSAPSGLVLLGLIAIWLRRRRR